VHIDLWSVKNIHEVDEENVYLTCTIGGRFNMVPIHVQYTIVNRTRIGFTGWSASYCLRAVVESREHADVAVECQDLMT
jgi:hypothetical protein